MENDQPRKARSFSWGSASTEKFRMRILVQQLETGLFYKGAGQWVANKEEAQTFTRSTEALEICLRQERGKAQILFSFQNSELDMVINPSEIENSYPS